MKIEKFPSGSYRMRKMYKDIPSDDEVRKILEHAKGTGYEIPLILTCYGLRKSEICVLTSEDIDGDVVSITKAKTYVCLYRWPN